MRDLSFARSAIPFSRSGGRGGGGIGGSPISAVAVLVCVRAGREDKCVGNVYFFRFQRSILKDWVGGGGRNAGVSLPVVVARFVCTPRDWESERA